MAYAAVFPATLPVLMLLMMLLLPRLSFSCRPNIRVPELAQFAQRHRWLVEKFRVVLRTAAERAINFAVCVAGLAV